jgi:cytidyltransferase-like protein
VSVSQSKPTVLVAGFFDLLHSGHVRFFEEAARHGRLIVSIGSDENSLASKGKKPIYGEEERRYMVAAVRHVAEAHLARTIGPLSFTEHVEQFKPDIFIINQDGHTEEKQIFCEEHGIQYLVMERTPKLDFKLRSTSELRGLDRIPHRLDLAGGFFDQKKLNSITPGPVITCNVEPMELVDRAGMSSSTRGVIHELFGNQLPADRSEQEIANIILAYENFDTEYISGATDAYGLVFSSVCRFDFQDSYRPHAVSKINDNTILTWLEQHLFLALTHPRPDDYRVFDGREKFPARELQQYAKTAGETWQAIKAKDLAALVKCVNQTRRHQQTLIPGYISSAVEPEIDHLEQAGHGVKLMGAGGAGYLMIVTGQQPPQSQRIVIRRQSFTI